VSRRPQQRPVSLVLIAIGMLSLPALTCQGARTQARPLDPGQSTPDVVPGPDTLLRPDTLPGPGARLDPEGRRWVDTTLASLSLHEKAGQLLNIWMDGGYASSTDPEFRRIVGLVEEHGLGGVTVSIGLPYSYAAKLNALQARARVPLLVTADFEAGPGTRLGAVWAIPWMIPMGGGTEFPPAMGFGAIGDESYAYELGRVTAREARALGVHLNFAPVLDVNSNPANPIINTRSYGEDPQMVARLGVAYIRGMRDGGLMSTAKHFPGHGDTRTDSHLELPVVDADRTRLDTLELIPFRRAIEAGVDAVMTAHLSVPAVVEPDAPPATLSAAGGGRRVDAGGSRASHRGDRGCGSLWAAERSADRCLRPSPAGGEGGSRPAHEPNGRVGTRGRCRRRAGARGLRRAHSGPIAHACARPRRVRATR
jgi:hypothetical protein